MFSRERPSFPLAHVARLALVATLALATACSDESPAFPDASGMDASLDVPQDRRPPTPDTGPADARGRQCTRSSQCDDGIDCTMDICGADGRCFSLADHSACDDRVYCNGIEQCDSRRGCIRGTPVSCNDNYTCTVDRCDEMTRACAHTPRDFDHDGDPDIRCMAAECSDAGTDMLPDGGSLCWRGGDCDDTNARVSSTLPEICSDAIDNNCNGFIDTMEPGGCRRPANDSCDDPLDVSRGGRFVVPLAGTTGDYTLRCSGSRLRNDVVLRLRLTEAQDVSITANSANAFVYVQVQADRCPDPMPADIRACVSGLPARWRTRALPAGTYYVIVGASPFDTRTSDAEINVELTPATMRPANDTCTTPTVIPATGGTFRGDLIDVADDVTTSCGGSDNPDVVYSLTLTQRSDVGVRLAGASNEFMAAALVDRCTRTPMTLRCDQASAARFTQHQLDPGTYFIIVEGRNQNAYTLDVTVSAPTPPVAGDACTNPIALTLGMPARGNLSTAENDVLVSCAGTGQRDLVYRFMLTSSSDVTIGVQGGATDYFYVGVQTTCNTTSSERRCFYGQNPQTTLRGLDPGTYFVVVKGTSTSDFTITVDARAPMPVMTATGNDTCAMATVIPTGGAIFTGNTSTLRHDYNAPCSAGMTAEDAVFTYRADRRQRLLVSTEGSAFDTVLWMTSGAMCPGTNVPGACNDDSPGGLWSTFTVTVEPGDYTIFVGGYGTGATSRGPYTLSVTPMNL